MKKKLIALFAACSMITTAVAGLVQTAYADDDPISIVVSDGATDTEKVLTFYYNTNNGINMVEGYLSLDNGATIDSAAITISIPAGMGDQAATPSTGYFLCLTYADSPLESADKSFATATVTVPGDVDVTATFSFDMFDGEDNDFSGSVVEATIPANSSTPPHVDAAVDTVAYQDTVLGTYENDWQTADIYGVKLVANDDVITGVRVFYDDNHKGELTFNTSVSGGGEVVFAVIFANESGTWTGPLPALEADMITAIVE